MSFAHWWIAISIDEDDYKLIEPYFAAASEKAALSEESRQAIEAWRRDPSHIEQDSSNSETAALLANPFIGAFNLPGFDALAEQFLMANGRFVQFCDEARVLKMAITARYTPVSILWSALGYDRAIRLPGRMGNMILRPDQIVRAQEKTHEAYSVAKPDALLQAAKRYCDQSIDDDSLREIIDFLPAALACAKALRRGLLTLARAQI
jgi:hypothetical protein